MPSPYGRHRPCRQVISSGSASTIWNSSATSRLLPIPGTPDERDELGGALAPHARERVAQLVDLLLAADERRRAAPARRRPPKRERAATTSQASNRLVLALRDDRLDLAVLDHVGGGAIGALADEDPVHRRRRLEPGRGVDDVPGHHPLALGRPAHRARRAPRPC